MLKAAIVTTCKGRLGYLQQCLPSWLAQEPGLMDFRVFVVDYGCPDGAADWCEEQRDPRLIAVRASNNTSVFNQSRARNIGMRRAIADGSQVLASVDADVQLKPHFLRRHVGAMFQNGWVLCKVGTDAGEGRICFVGTSVMTADIFKHVRGYDESLKGYGHDDTDFYWRCERAQPGAVGWLPSDCVHLPNSDAERIRFYDQEKLSDSIEANLAVAMRVDRQVNPGDWGSS